MALETRSIQQIRAITFIGAGAALLAVIGYLLMKSDRKKKPPNRPRRRSSQTTLNVNNLEESQKEQEKEVIVEIIDSKKSADLEIVDNLVANIALEMVKNNQSLEIKEEVIGVVDNVNKTNNNNQLIVESDKLSETSSDSGHGQSEAYYLNHDEDEHQFASLDINNNNSNNEEKLNIKKSSSSSNITDKIIPIKEELEEKTNHNNNNNSNNNSNKTKNKLSKKTITTATSIQQSKSNNNILSSQSKPPKKSQTTQFNNINENSNSQNNKLTKQTYPNKMMTSSQSYSEPSKRTAKLSTASNESNYQDLVVYEFNFPRNLCGKLIGKNGVHVDYIRSRTQTQIAVRNDPQMEDQQIVCVSGRLEDVDRALDIISNRFPPKQYPNISFKPISKPIVYRRYNNSNETIYHDTKVFVAPNMYVDLNSVVTTSSDSSNNRTNVNVTAVVSTSHCFIQLPTNPTYEHLQKLDENMLKSYSNLADENIPLMNEPIEFGTICVAPTSYGWHRAMVTSYQSLNDVLVSMPDYNEKCGLATVKFLDYGGYLTIPTNQLRQLRSDFMLLPFQAIECYLDGILAYEGYEEEGKNYFSDLIRGARLQVQVSGYADDGVPFIKLFLSNDQFEDCNVNDELVKNGFAYYINSNPIVNESIYNSI